MTHLTALRNSVLCGLAVVAVAGCGAHLTAATSAAGTGVTTPTGATTAAPAPTTAAASDTSGVSKQISDINNQLSSVAGQLNSANAGLNSSEGDPSQ